ncbi:CNH domain-containing protein [Lentinula lateritia]|uniref:CNH domain-containing protein n=1 Tax=Lentinula lateritia TaxID=40482 RepID=A0ABQ8VD37_9AGAR|nr:CNH domain-containing protein [Lentinula lateritia]
MENKRPLSPEVPDEDLQQLYDQVWAGFGSEDTQSIESASSYTPSTASVLSPRDGVRRQDTSEQDREDIGRIYSVYAADNLPDVVYNYGSPSSATNGSNIYQHQRDTDNYYGYISSPISPVSTAAATYARSARSASIRSNGRERSGSGSARRLPLPPTPASGWNAPTQMTTAKEYQRQGHVSSMSTSSISSVASSRKLPATPASAPVVTLGGRDLDRLGVGLPTSPRPSKSPSPTRGRGGVDSGLSLAADYLQPEANLQPRRNRSRSPYQTNRSMQVVSGRSANTSPALVAAPLPPTKSPRSYFDEKSRKDPGLSMNRWNSTSSSIVNGVNAQGLRIPPPPPLLSFQPPSQLRQPQYSMPEPDLYADPNAGPSSIVRRPTDMLRELSDGANFDRYHPEERHDQLGVDADEASYDWDEDYELQQQRFAADAPRSYQSYSSSQSQPQGSSSRRNRKPKNPRDWTYEYSEGNDNEYSSDEFINYSLLSHLAVQLRDKVPRGVHVKASIPYEGAFTGKDIVDTVQSLIRKHLLLNHSLSLTNSTPYPASFSSSSSSPSVDRRAALHVARSLQCQLLFYEVDGGGRELCDGVEEVYMFSEDDISSSPSGSGFGFGTMSPRMTSGHSTVLPLPTAVVTMLTRCYVPTCVDDKPCYASDCPKRGLSIQRMLSPSSKIAPVVINITDTSSYPSLEEERKPWRETVPEEVFSRIPEGEVKRQVAIHDLITKETDYLADLIVLETQFMLPLSEWVVSISGSQNLENGLVATTSSHSPPPTPSGSTAAFVSPPRMRKSSSSFSSSSSTSSPLLAFSPALQTLLPLLHALITAQTRLLDHLRVRARESQYGIIEGIGDLYLERAASSEWRAGWGGGWVQGRGFVSTADRAKEGWTGGRGYDEWVGVWATCGLGGLGIFSPAISTTTDENGNEDWKKIIAEQEMQRQQKQRESNPTAAEDESTGEVGTETGGIKEPRGYLLPDIDLKKFTELLALPAAHLKSYPSLLSTILAESSRSADPVSSLSSPSSSTDTAANSTSPAALKTNKKKAGKEKEENENPDASYLREAIRAMRALWGYGKVKTFQLSMNVCASGGDDNKGSMGVMGEAAIKWEWFNLVSEEERKEIGKTEVKRQAIIFELIKGEMGYVKDLENVEHMYITPLVNSSTSNTPIIPAVRLSQFLSSVFNNIQSLHFHHLTLLQALFRIQYDEHPTIRSVSAPILDAALNWREAYMEYIPNYPIAAYTIDSEMRTNPAFKDFVQRCTRHPDAHRLDMKNFINRPIPRLLRYELLLKGILEETPVGPIAASNRQGGSLTSSRGANAVHEDHSSIPQVLDVIRRLGKDTEPGVVNAKSKVELWKYNEGLVFKQGEWIDMDLLAESRSLIHSGKLLRQTDGLEWSGWTELYVLLFDNYMVLTKPKEREDVTKYHVNRRPIPLDLLTIDSLTEPPVQRGTGPGLLRGLRSQGTIGQGLEASSPNELLASSEGSTPVETPSSEMSPSTSSRLLYPITLHHLGRHSVSPTTSSLIPPLPAGPSSSRTAQQAKPPPNIILYTESATARAEWGAKLQEALGIRRVVQESNKVFEIETLSSETFVTPVGSDALGVGNAGVLGIGYSPDTVTGKVTCSVPFNTADGRGLVAVGCAEGVWIGFRHDPKSMRRVLHLKLVAQCAMLEDYGIFLVLADKSLFAYHIEALVPSSFQSASTSQVPQKLNGNKDVHFFTVGTLHGRTLVIYMKKKGLDSIFRVLEPVSEKIKERAKPPSGFGSRLFVRSLKSEWFKIYRDFFLPSESYDVIFLKARIAILCSKGFEIMDLNEHVSIPSSPRYANEHRSTTASKSAEDEFLLCYNEFGVYVDKHGDPNRPSGTIEWEGTAERVAVHAPYVLLFDSRFIEIRHLETGRLAQIIPGNDIRCIWDGRGVSPLTPMSPSAQNLSFPVLDRSDEPLNQDALVHAVMNAPDVVGGGSRGRFVVQQVFELLPTVPLFLPDQAPDGSSVVGSYSNSGSGSGSGIGAPGLRLSVGQSSNVTPPLPYSPQQLRNSPSWRS